MFFFCFVFFVFFHAIYNGFISLFREAIEIQEVVVIYVVVKPTTPCSRQSPVVFSSSQLCVAPNNVTVGSTWSRQV